MMPGLGNQRLSCRDHAYVCQPGLFAVRCVFPDRLPRSDPVLEDMGSASAGSCPIAEYVAILPRLGLW
jgi:hypothetical protein